MDGEAQLTQRSANLVTPGVEPRLVPVQRVHLVHGDHEIADTEESQQRRVGARLPFGTQLRVDHQQCRGRPGRAGDQIAHEFAMPRAIDDDHFALRGADTDARGVERHRLIPLELQCIERERPLQRHVAAGACRLHPRDPSIGQQVQFMQQAAQQRRLAMVDVPGQADRERARHHM